MHRLMDRQKDRAISKYHQIFVCGHIIRILWSQIYFRIVLGISSYV